MDPKSHSGTEGPAAAEELPATARQVADYLRQHPDFLADHEELLTVLTPPGLRHGNNVVDMQQFALRRMQDELGRAKHQHQALIATSRSNLASQARIHTAVLAVIGARSFEQLIQTVVGDFTMLLDLDAVTLCVEAAGGKALSPPLGGVQILPEGTVDVVIGHGRDVLLIDHMPGTAEIFGSGAGLVQSQALLRLAVGPGVPAGMLALGARNPTRFKPGQGSELLGFLAQSLALTLGAWLDAAL